MLHLKRILLDTNIYGFLADSPDRNWLFMGVKSHKVTVCGSAIIRQELRNIPKKAVLGNANLRKLCLELYDALVDEKRNYAVTELVKTICAGYGDNYRGTHLLSELEKDFLIIASASLDRK